MSFESQPQLKLAPDEAKQGFKACQEKGIGITIGGGRVAPEFPEGVSLTPVQEQAAADYLQSIYPQLSGVKSENIGGIIRVLEEFEGDESSVNDMVHYGPSANVGERMSRINALRQRVIQAQNESSPGLARMQSVKASTFVRSHIHELGLYTTKNFLEAACS